MGAMDSISFRSFFARFMSYSSDKKLWSAFGYSEGITPQDYWKAYKRKGVSTRIVKAFPAACWRDGAVVRDDAGEGLIPEDEGYSAFTHAFYQLNSEVKAFHYLERLDRLTRIGQYGIMVLGFRDGKDLDKPLQGQAELAYMAVYPERAVTINRWDTDRSSERFGLPVTYSVQILNSVDPGSTQTVPNPAFTVHHSRVIHVVENPDDNEVFGEPCLRPVWNYLQDLEKVAGSSAETFWLNARGGMAIEAAADAKLTPDAIAEMRKQVEEYEEQLRRVIAIQGAKVSTISASVSSPKDNVEMLFSLISGTTGIPQRVLFGSERGELASSEDANSWEARVDERRKNHCGPSILDKFVDRMIETGNLPQPTGDWWSVWPEASAASPEKEADIALKRTQALVAYANSAADQFVSPQEFRPWIGLDAEPNQDEMDDDEEEDDEDTLGQDLPELEEEEEDDDEA